MTETRASRPSDLHSRTDVDDPDEDNTIDTRCTPEPDSGNDTSVDQDHDSVDESNPQQYNMVRIPTGLSKSTDRENENKTSTDAYLTRTTSADEEKDLGNDKREVISIFHLNS